MKIVLDTNIIIEFLRRPDTLREETLFFKMIYSHNHTPAVASVTVSELWAGQTMNNTKTRAFVMELISYLEVIYPVYDIATKTGELMRSNRGMDLGDATIAATCIVHDLPLLTLNTKHFASMPGLSLVT